MRPVTAAENVASPVDDAAVAEVPATANSPDVPVQASIQDTFGATVLFGSGVVTLVPSPRMVAQHRVLESSVLKVTSTVSEVAVRAAKLGAATTPAVKKVCLLER